MAGAFASFPETHECNVLANSARLLAHPSLALGPQRPGLEGTKGTKKGPNRVDSCGRSEEPIFRGKPGGAPSFRAGRFPPYTASIPAASMQNSPPL